MVCLAASLCRPETLAWDRDALLPDEHVVHLATALEFLNMDLSDLAFDRDVAQPECVLPRVREVLAQPLRLPSMAETIAAAWTSGDSAAVWKLAAELLDVAFQPDPVRSPQTPPGAWPDAISPELAAALDRYLADVSRVRDALARAFEGVAFEERGYLAASLLAGVFNAEDRPERIAALTGAGIPEEEIQSVIEEKRKIDPAPAAKAFLDAAQRIDMAALIEAGALLQRAVERLAHAAADIDRWPETPVRLGSFPLEVWIGTPGADAYTNAACLILDPGGNDVYSGAAGCANGLLGGDVAVVIDLDGDDAYRSGGLLGAGSALFGAAVLHDAGGNDVYQAEYVGQGAGLFGTGWLEDGGGDDTYRALACGQAAATFGLGILRDRDGDDRYRIGYRGQAYAGVSGIGVLVDDAGHDVYFAGGAHPDHDRHDGRFLSLSQGFATGMRPFAGGGVAALLDRSGNDTYTADVYGQGASYWYAAGFLLDASGQDVYTVYHYGQGSGIHISAGFLFDGSGDDRYHGFALSQGNAHDFGVGMLLDRAGHDTYTADHFSQGRGMNNSLGLLVDAEGNDVYLARDAQTCQGVGDDGHHREYGSLGLLLDLEGRDHYTAGGADGTTRVRPNFGVVHDVQPDRDP